MAGAAGRAGSVHAARIPRKLGAHLAALLIAVLLAPVAGAADIEFDPSITAEEFHLFSSLVAQAIYATPVEPASSRGVLSFGVGVAATAIQVDENASYWVRAVGSDFTNDGYVLVPKLVVSKGLGFGNISASYAQIPDSDLEIIGGSLDISLIDGGIARPNISVRGAYSEIRGVEELELSTYGAEAFLSISFGIVTPYAAAGRVRTESVGRIVPNAPLPEIVLSDEFDVDRYTVGVRLNLAVTKLVVEATEAEDRSYAAKITLGL